MHSLRIPKAYYFAAFFLGALIALLIVAPARAGSLGSDHVETTPANSGVSPTST